jgi:hypothetical protein
VKDDRADAVWVVRELECHLNAEPTACSLRDLAHYAKIELEAAKARSLTPEDAMGADAPDTRGVISKRDRFIWVAICAAIEAVRWQQLPEAKRHSSAVVDAWSAARTALVSEQSEQWLADLFRPLGPPSLEQLMTAHSRSGLT